MLYGYSCKSGVKQQTKHNELCVYRFTLQEEWKNIHRQTLTIQQVYGTPHASGPGAEQLWYMFTCQSEYSFPPQHLNWKNKSRSSKTTYQWKYQHSFRGRPLFLVKLDVFSSSTAEDLLRLCCGRTIGRIFVHCIFKNNICPNGWILVEFASTSSAKLHLGWQGMKHERWMNILSCSVFIYWANSFQRTSMNKY